jgi:phage FluMu protein Com
MTASSAWREPRPPIELKTVRCKACRRRLGDFAETARGEIVCPKCSVMNALPRR